MPYVWVCVCVCVSVRKTQSIEDTIESKRKERVCVCMGGKWRNDCLPPAPLPPPPTIITPCLTDQRARLSPSLSRSDCFVYGVHGEGKVLRLSLAQPRHCYKGEGNGGEEGDKLTLPHNHSGRLSIRNRPPGRRLDTPHDETATAPQAAMQRR